MTSETALGSHWPEQCNVDQQGRERAVGTEQGGCRREVVWYGCPAQIQGIFRAQHAVQEQRVLGDPSRESCLHAGTGGFQTWKI